MMDIYAYNEALEHIGVLDNSDFSSLIWTERFFSAGSFEIKAVATKRAVNVLQPYRYIYRQDVDEAMYINSIVEQHSADEGKVIIASGFSLDHLFTKRRVPEQVNYTSVMTTLSRCTSFGCDAVYDFTNDFGTAPDSSVPEMSAEEFIRYAMAQKNYGFNVRLNPSLRRLEASISIGRDLVDSVIFSEDLDNLMNSVYSYSEEGCYNCIFARTKYVAGVRAPNGLPTYSEGTELTGLRRNEKYILVDPVIRTGYEHEGDIKAGRPIKLTQYQYVDYDASMNVLIEAVKAAKSDFSENYSGDIVPSGYKYRADFDVGDIVAIRNDARGARYAKRVEEVEEVFDSGGIRVTPTFGTPLKTIYDLIGE